MIWRDTSFCAAIAKAIVFLLLHTGHAGAQQSSLPVTHVDTTRIIQHLHQVAHSAPTALYINTVVRRLPKNKLTERFYADTSTLFNGQLCLLVQIPLLDGNGNLRRENRVLIFRRSGSGWSTPLFDGAINNDWWIEDHFCADIDGDGLEELLFNQGSAGRGCNNFYEILTLLPGAATAIKLRQSEAFPIGSPRLDSTYQWIQGYTCYGNVQIISVFRRYADSFHLLGYWEEEMFMEDTLNPKPIMVTFPSDGGEKVVVLDGNDDPASWVNRYLKKSGKR